MIATLDMGTARQRLGNVIARLTPAARLRIFVYIVFALQFAKVARLIPIEDVFDGSPLTQSQFSQIYSDVTNDRQLIEATNRSWGYDPFIGAGQPIGTGRIAESRGFIFWDRLLRQAASPSSTIKLFV